MVFLLTFASWWWENVLVRPPPSQNMLKSLSNLLAKKSMSKTVSWQNGSRTKRSNMPRNWRLFTSSEPFLPLLWRMPFYWTGCVLNHEDQDNKNLSGCASWENKKGLLTAQSSVFLTRLFPQELMPFKHQEVHLLILKPCDCYFHISYVIFWQF